jgi:hypothetical protein
MPGVPPLAPRVRAYLGALDLMAIYVAPDGSVGIGRDPGRADAVAAWWVANKRTAEAVAARATESEPRMPRLRSRRGSALW